MWIRATRTFANLPILINSNAITSVAKQVDDCEIGMIDGKTVYVCEDFESFAKLLNAVTPPKLYVSEIKMPLSTRVDSLDMTARAQNAIRRAGIETLGGLLLKFKDEKSFVSLRGCGDVTKAEIISKVNECGYKFDWED